MTPTRLLTAALLASLAVAGCKRDADRDATTPTTATGSAPAPLPPASSPAPAAAVATVGTVELGNAIGPDNRVTTASTNFAARDTIYASVTVDGATGGTLGTRWTFQDGQEVHSETKTLAAGGPTTHEFHISKPDGWPVGRYRLEVSLDGRVVQTREFEVR